jgi:hypothetical protein
MDQRNEQATKEQSRIRSVQCSARYSRDRESIRRKVRSNTRADMDDRRFVLER